MRQLGEHDLNVKGTRNFRLFKSTDDRLATGRNRWIETTFGRSRFAAAPALIP